MYGVFGGTPRYHALVDPSRPPAEEIVTLLMQPRAILENEVRFLLGSEQIRDPAPYNAILAAIAGGETKFNGIQQLIGVERGALSGSLRTLLELGWIRREFPFGENSQRRALYRVADPFLTFLYRFVAPLASALQFSGVRPESHGLWSFLFLSHLTERHITLGEGGYKCLTLWLTLRIAAPPFRCISPSWVTCAQAPLRQQVDAVEIRTVIAIGPVKPATVPTTG